MDKVTRYIRDYWLGMTVVPRVSAQELDREVKEWTELSIPALLTTAANRTAWRSTHRMSLQYDSGQIEN